MKRPRAFLRFLLALKSESVSTDPSHAGAIIQYLVANEIPRSYQVSMISSGRGGIENSRCGNILNVGVVGKALSVP